MATRAAEHARAPAFIDPPGYARHRPEQTLLYQIVVQHYPAFLAVRAAQGRPLPRYVQEEFGVPKVRAARARVLARALRELSS